MMAGGCFDYLDILKVLEQQQNEHWKKSTLAYKKTWYSYKLQKPFIKNGGL